MAIPSQEVSAERARVYWPERHDLQAIETAGDSTLRVPALHIRQIELVGFKSFRERTVLRFPTGVTGIVGPNGCGKSNVVDAVRWVLGEQSAKRLRGEGMEDVVFRGNDRQGPVGMAQVSILLESDGLREDGDRNEVSELPAEIMVTRRYLRSGESEYLMNGLPCRLRDITELFLGTGLGNKAYAIIEQDRVGQLIRAKPEEIRVFIEEAAGTTLYRSRREIAERKMERTRENLVRVQDLLREVERNLSGLRRQAKRAQQYRELRAQIEDLEIGLSSWQRTQLAGELAGVENERASAKVRDSQLAAAIADLEREREVARELESTAHSRLQEVQAAAFEARSECEACRHQLAGLEARGAELVAQVSAAERDVAVATEELARLVSERSGAETDLGQLKRDAAVAERALTQAEAQSEGAKSDLARDELIVQESKDHLVEGMSEEARVRNAVAVSEQRRGDAEKRGGQLQVALDALGAREVAALERREHAERRLMELQGRADLLEKDRHKRADELRRSLADRKTLESAVGGMREGLGRVRSRRDSLREIEDSHAAYGDGVRAILAASSREEALGLVAEVLDIPAELERAVAAVLGEQLQAVVTRDHAVARDAVQALRRAGAGRAICVPRNTRVALPSGVCAGGRRLLEMVAVRSGYEDVARALLESAVLVNDLDEALALWEADRSGRTFVTIAGETVGSAGVVAGGNERAEERLLAERRELRALDHDVDRRERELDAAHKRLDGLNVLVTACEKELQEVDRELAQVTIAVVGAEKDVEQAAQEIVSVKEQMAAIASESEGVRSSRLEVDDCLQTLNRELADAKGRRAALEEAATQADARRAEAQRRVAKIDAEITERRVALAEMRARCGALESAIERLDRSEQEAQRRIGVFAERRASDAAALEITRQETTTGRERLRLLEESEELLAAKVREAGTGIDTARAAMASAERSIADLHSELETLRARMGALDVQATERRLNIAHLDETIRDRYRKELAEQIPAMASGVADDEIPEKEHLLERLRQRIADMGEVNVAALGEVEEHEERRRLLETQRADIEGALEDLRKTIARLNRASRARFRETFERVDGTFREVFPKLFQGGKAHLRLTDEDHLLDSGVEIVAQPPGKRVGPLDLLSGGEKALTAVSLIFALFLIKPSPFCFLDEVDAPLDDANIGRFNGMVKEMSGRSQVILITHNKRTMEVADTLYGITMQEPGVSKVVSVRVPE